MDAARELLLHVRSSGRVLLTGPEGPDGDSFGACLALQIALRRLAPGVVIDVAGDVGFRYAFLPGAAHVVRDADVRDYDGVLVCDGDRRRLPGPVSAAFAAARWTGLLDHHRSTDPSGYTWVWLDPSSESTCVMVHALLRAWHIDVDRDLAALLYTGLIFDTGGFRYSNTRASSHVLAAELLATGIDHAEIMLRVLIERRAPGLRLLARMLGTAQFWAGGRIAWTAFPLAWASELGAGEADVEGVVDVLQHTEGVEVAVVAVERGPDRVKISLRSRGRVDVATLARELAESGGGHVKAAGAVLGCSLPAAERQLREALERRLGAAPVPG